MTAVSPTLGAPLPGASAEGGKSGRLDVSVLIVTYNNASTIEACVRSLLAPATCPREIIVVDNDSSDHTIAVLDSIAGSMPSNSTIRVHPSTENLGFAAGVNAAARHATSSWLLLVNPDAVVEHDTVSTLLAFATAHRSHGIYGGRSLEPDGTLNPASCFGPMTLWSLVCFATGLSTIGRGRVWTDPESLGDWQRDTVRQVAVISGALMLVEAALWESLAGFDERFFLYAEDADLCARARTLGRAPVLVPAARFQHSGGGSSPTKGAKVVMLHRGKVEYLHTHWTPNRATLGLRLLLTGVWVRHVAGRMLGRSDDWAWTVAWKRRNEWRHGYSLGDQP